MQPFGRRLSAKSVYYIYFGTSSLLLSLVISITEIYYINVINMNAFQLVIIGTVLETADFIFEIPTGILADTKGKRPALITGSVITGLSFIVEGIFPKAVLFPKKEQPTKEWLAALRLKESGFSSADT